MNSPAFIAPAVAATHSNSGRLALASCALLLAASSLALGSFVMLWIIAAPFALLALVMSNLVIQQQQPEPAGSVRRLSAAALGIVASVGLYAACLGMTGHAGAFELALQRGTAPQLSVPWGPVALWLAACAGLTVTAWILGCRNRTVLLGTACYWLAYAPLTILVFIVMARFLGLPLTA